jgi:hypothetical protein
VEITAIREDLGLVAKKTITVEIYDLDDEPPTNVQINGAAVIDGQVILANDKDAGFLIGTLSKTNLLLFVFRHRNIARVGNLKRAYFFCIYNLDRKVVSPMPIIAVTNSDDDRYISNISDGILSFDFITVERLHKPLL